MGDKVGDAQTARTIQTQSMRDNKQGFVFDVTVRVVVVVCHTLGLPR
jgi:hypothetical protein